MTSSSNMFTLLRNYSNMKVLNGANFNMRGRERIAFVIATNVLGGHEFQSKTLIEDLSRYANVTVHLNREEDRLLFEDIDVRVKVNSGLFLEKGWMAKQVLYALQKMTKIRAVLSGYDRIVVSAGSVEAGICTSVALLGHKHVTLYLPSFFDRSLVWGPVGHFYNFLLARFGVFYENILTINRIQARIIKTRMRRPTLVIPNKINDVPIASKSNPGRILIIGRLDGQKRVSELLEWLDFERTPYSDVLIIGDGPEREKLQAKASKSKYISISILGWQTIEQQNELIDGNDVLILNSLVEGEPLVIREANMRGIVVIARDIIGSRGVTSKGNRYGTSEELRDRLNKAIKGRLHVFKRGSSQNQENIRR